MIFTTETTTDVAPDALLTLLYSKYAGRRHGRNSENNTAHAKRICKHWRLVIWFPFCFLFVCLDVFSSYFACLKMSRDQNLRPCLCKKFFFQELFDHGDCWDWTTSVVQRAPSFGWLFEDGEDRLDRKRLSSAGPDGTLMERNVIQPDLTDLSADARVGIQPDLSEAPHESDGTTCKYITYITHFNLHHTVDVRQKTGSRNLTSNLATSPETGQLGHPLQAYMRWQQKDARKKEVWQKNWCNSGACNAVWFFFARDILLMLCLTADRWWMLRRRLYELAERQVWMVWMVWIVWDEMKSKKSKKRPVFEETKQMSLINFLWIDMNQWLLSWFVELAVSPQNTSNG